jgi:hypothetical protein
MAYWTRGSGWISFGVGTIVISVLLNVLLILHVVRQAVSQGGGIFMTFKSSNLVSPEVNI